MNKKFISSYISNSVLGPILKKQSGFSFIALDDTVSKTVFCDFFQLPYDLILIIEEYFDIHHYQLKLSQIDTNHNLLTKISNVSIAKEVWNLFLSFLTMYFHQDSKSQLINTHKLEIYSHSLSNFCCVGISRYRFVIHKENLSSIIQSGENWDGETKHERCDCHFANKTPEELIKMMLASHHWTPFSRHIRHLDIFLKIMRLKQLDVNIIFF